MADLALVSTATQARIASPFVGIARQHRIVGTLVVLGLVLAAVLRIVGLDLIEFRDDEADLIRAAEDVVELGRVPLQGLPGSQGVAPGPHFTYLLAPVVALARDPVVATGAIAVVNVAGVAGVAWLAVRAFGGLAGVVATWLYAASPPAVLYSRKIWEPDLLAPLAVLLFVALERGVVQRRAWWAAMSFPILLVGGGIHFSFLTLAPLALAPAAVLLRGRQWRPLAVGLGLALLIGLPFVVHLEQTDFEDYRYLRFRGAQPASVDLDGLGYTLRASTGWGAPMVAEVLPLGRALPEPLAGAVPGVETALVAAATLLSLGRVLSPATAWSARARLLGLLLWLGLPVALTIRHSLPLHPHYYLVTIPAPFLLVGASAQWLVDRVRLLDVRGLAGGPGGVPARGAAWPVRGAARSGSVISRVLRSSRWSPTSEARRAIWRNCWWPGAGGRPLLAIGLAIVAAIVGLQGVALGRLFDSVATTAETCFGAPLRVTQQTADGLLAFAASTGSPHAFLENDAGDADPLAYLVRPAFGTLQLASPGAVGLDVSLENKAPVREASPGSTGTWATRLLDQKQSLDLRYPSGVHLTAAALLADPRPGWRLRLALGWWVEASASRLQPLVWQAMLVDAAGQPVLDPNGNQVVVTGLRHVPAGLQGQRAVSWFTFQLPPSAAPGQYRAGVRLVDPQSHQPLAYAASDGEQATEWLSRTTAASPAPRLCRRSVDP